jgi:hypothetical protein
MGEMQQVEVSSSLHLGFVRAKILVLSAVAISIAQSLAVSQT